VLIDGGAIPEVNLQEFAMLIPHLADDGILLVDDLQEIPPLPRYPAPRPFGKATLILPALILAEHCRVPKPDQNRPETWTNRFVPDPFISVQHPTFIQNACGDPLIKSLLPFDYTVIGQSHRMLVVARRPTLERYLARLPDLTRTPKQREIDHSFVYTPGS
jgi:hypothetical protein